MAPNQNAAAAVAAPSSADAGEAVIGTAVAVGQLPESVRTALELRKAQNVVAGKLAALNWGKGLDFETRRAIADWGARHGIDVTTEIDVLGGRPYRNVTYFLNRLAALAASGKVEYAVPDHIHDDPRLAKLGAAGEQERARRLRERIAYNVPDAAVAAVAFRIKLRHTPIEFVGVKWCGGGTRKNDPVGEAFPVETAESRAARRACRYVVSHIPELQAVLEEADDDAALSVTPHVEQANALLRADAAQSRTRRLVAGTLPVNPEYAVGEADAAEARANGEAMTRGEVPTRVMPPAAPLSAAARARLAEPDPYTGEPVAAGETEFQDDRDLAAE